MKHTAWWLGALLACDGLDAFESSVTRFVVGSEVLFLMRTRPLRIPYASLTIKRSRAAYSTFCQRFLVLYGAATSCYTGEMWNSNNVVDMGAVAWWSGHRG